MLSVPRFPLWRSPLLGTVDGATVFLVCASWAFLYWPVFLDLSDRAWSTEEHSYGPVILACSLWLIWDSRSQISKLAGTPSTLFGCFSLTLALLMYALGRSQDIDSFSVGSQILFISGAFLLFLGFSTLKVITLPLFLLVFVVPLPATIVDLATGPLKSAVSTVAETILHYFQYPISRSGVILTVGKYQLLVADACSGLTSMFTLEAIGIIYLRMMGYTNRLRNIILCLLLVPIAFVANVFRVIILVLTTYHLGTEAAEGLFHGAAGLILFLIASVLMVGVDKLLELFPRLRNVTTLQKT